jgi:hypothetical protein
MSEPPSSSACCPDSAALATLDLMSPASRNMVQPRVTQRACGAGGRAGRAAAGAAALLRHGLQAQALTAAWVWPVRGTGTAREVCRRCAQASGRAARRASSRAGGRRRRAAPAGTLAAGSACR